MAAYGASRPLRLPRSSPFLPHSRHSAWGTGTALHVEVFGRRQQRGSRHAQLTGVQKAPRHEVAGSWAPAGHRALWGFDVSADADGWWNVARKGRDVWTGEVGSLQWASRQALGAHQRALGALIAVIGSREIIAGIEPARRNGKVATVTVGLSHDVSTVLGIGRQLGSQPRANTSITIMRAPQRGHGQGSTCRASGVISGCFCGSAGGTIWSSTRAVAMFSARLALAKSP